MEAYGGAFQEPGVFYAARDPHGSYSNKYGFTRYCQSACSKIRLYIYACINMHTCMFMYIYVAKYQLRSRSFWEIVPCTRVCLVPSTARKKRMKQQLEVSGVVMTR